MLAAMMPNTMTRRPILLIACSPHQQTLIVPSAALTVPSARVVCKSGPCVEIATTGGCVELRTRTAYGYRLPWEVEKHTHSAHDDIWKRPGCHLRIEPGQDSDRAVLPIERQVVSLGMEIIDAADSHERVQLEHLAPAPGLPHRDVAVAAPDRKHLPVGAERQPVSAAQQGQLGDKLLSRWSSEVPHIDPGLCATRGDD